VRLEISVNDAPPVRLGQSFRYLDRNIEDLSYREGTRLREQGMERLTFH